MIAGLIAAFVAISLTLGGEAGTQAAPKIPHFTIWMYKVKVGTKGGGTLDGNYPSRPADARKGDVIEEHFKASYSVDSTFPNVTFAIGQVPGYRNSAGDTQRAIVNGTWSNRGTKWIDPENGITGPFSCSGRVQTSIPSSSSVLGWSKKGTTISFKLKIPADMLTSPGECDAQTYGAQGSMVFANNRAYTTTFTISSRDLGKRTITKQISGPMHSLQWRQYTCHQCTFNTAWQGVVKFTLVRVFKR